MELRNSVYNLELETYINRYKKGEIMEKVKIKKIISAIMTIIICMFGASISLYARSNSEINPKAEDIVSRDYSQTFSFSKKYVSLNPDIGAEGIPSSYKTVSFKVLLKGSIQYERLTGRYVSASTPTATLIYSGPVALGLYNVSTSKYDSGSSIKFSFKADIKGTVDPGIPVTINYGSVSNSFSVKK